MSIEEVSAPDLAAVEDKVIVSPVSSSCGRRFLPDGFAFPDVDASACRRDLSCTSSERRVAERVEDDVRRWGVRFDSFDFTIFCRWKETDTEFSFSSNQSSAKAYGMPDNKTTPRNYVGKLLSNPQSR